MENNKKNTSVLHMNTYRLTNHYRDKIPWE